jgi:hypothetical protein
MLDDLATVWNEREPGPIPNPYHPSAESDFIGYQFAVERERRSTQDTFELVALAQPLVTRKLQDAYVRSREDDDRCTLLEATRQTTVREVYAAVNAFAELEDRCIQLTVEGGEPLPIYLPTESAPIAIESTPRVVAEVNVRPNSVRLTTSLPVALASASEFVRKRSPPPDPGKTDETPVWTLDATEQVRHFRWLVIEQSIVRIIEVHYEMLETLPPSNRPLESWLRLQVDWDLSIRVLERLWQLCESTTDRFTESSVSIRCGH